MPPSRRHSRTTTPPGRRPRVAGLRRPSAAGSATTDHPEVIESEPTEVLDEPDAETQVLEVEPVPVDERAVQERVVQERTVARPVIGEPGPVEDATVEEKPAPAPRTRPTGKRRAVGLTQPADLAKAEAEVTDDADADWAPPTNPILVRVISLGVAVLILVALAIWFRGEANSRSDGADANNQALIDTAKSSEVIGQVRDAIEKSLTYNYTDLESTARAVNDNLSGRALCEYDQLFGQVKKLAPEQKLVLSTRVRDIGVTRLEDDQAMLLVFVDQTTTRADQNQTTASGAQFAVRAERQGDRWKIAQFDMLGQPLPNGQPLPQC